MASSFGEIGHAKKRAFCAAFARKGTILDACKAAGISRQTYYNWSEHDPAFVAAVGLARAEFGDALEAKCYRMALKGDASVPLLIVGLKMAGRFVDYGPQVATTLPRIYEREVARDEQREDAHRDAATV